MGQLAVDRCEFVYSLDDLKKKTDMSCHKSMVLPDSLFFGVFLGSKCQNFHRIQDRFKTNFYTLKAHIFLLYKKINFGHSLDDLWQPP